MVGSDAPSGKCHREVTTRMNKIAIVVAATDGIVSSQSGIGSVARAFFSSIDEAKTKPPLSSLSWNLFAAAPNLDPSSADYDRELFESIGETCRRYGGEVLLFDSEHGNDKLSTVWAGKNPDLWYRLAENCMRVILERCEAYERVIVFAHGSPLLLLRRFVDRDNVNIMTVPHFIWNHHHDSSKVTVHGEIERDAYSRLVDCHDDYVACIGDYVKDVMQRIFSLPDEKFVMLRNRISPHNYSRQQRAAELERDSRISQLNIPPEQTDVLFSWGRCDSQKGHTTILKAFARIMAGSPSTHLVILAPVSVGHRDEYDRMQDLVKYIPEGRYTIIYEYDDVLPIAMVGWQRCRMAIFASRREYAPIAPLEALFFGHRALRVIYSDIEPNIECLAGISGTAPFRLDDDAQLSETVIDQLSAESFSARDGMPTYANSISEFFSSLLLKTGM
ncbi:MAG: hypothetical protein H6R00_1672 [Proteobacteria bacterium]|nr:hypothetical protein [Pseudomonadota bacterium]